MKHIFLQHNNPQDAELRLSAVMTLGEWQSVVANLERGLSSPGNLTVQGPAREFCVAINSLVNRYKDLIMSEEIKFKKQNKIKDDASGESEAA